MRTTHQERVLDTNRFDQLTKELATARSRRGVLKILAGAAFALGVTGIKARTTRAQCGNRGDTCTAQPDCCGSLNCLDGLCGGPQAGCSGPEENCSLDSECCGRLTCIDGACGGPSAGCTFANDACESDDECCGRLTCVESGVCGGPSAGCAADAESCTVNGDCCGSLYCEGGFCTGGVASISGLPDTGTGSANETTAAGLLLGVAVVGGVAIAAAGAKLRTASSETA